MLVCIFNYALFSKFFNLSFYIDNDFFLSTHQHVITSAIFKETDGRILISFCVWNANTILFKHVTMSCLVYAYSRSCNKYFKKST